MHFKMIHFNIKNTKSRVGESLKYVTYAHPIPLSLNDPTSVSDDLHLVASRGCWWPQKRIIIMWQKVGLLISVHGASCSFSDSSFDVINIHSDATKWWSLMKEVGYLVIVLWLTYDVALLRIWATLALATCHLELVKNLGKNAMPTLFPSLCFSKFIHENQLTELN